MSWQPRHVRLALLALALGAAALAAILVLTALNEKVTYFYTPATLLREGPKLLAQAKNIRLGGLVEKGSVARAGTILRFSVTDLEESITVTYEGLPPDLFREGQGVVAEGRLKEARLFEAHMLLAKHDETYMPPDVAKALKKQEMERRAVGGSP